MNVFIVAVDEPIYLNPYIANLIDRCRDSVVGVAVLTRRGRRPSLARAAAMGLLALVVFSPRDWLRILTFKTREWLAGVLHTRTHHTLSDICAARQVPFEVIDSVNSTRFAERIRSAGVDVLLHQTPQILRGGILRAPRIAVINRHMSFLPSYRGAWPVFWQFAEDAPALGATIHVVNEGIDSGPIIVQRRVERRPGESIAAAYRRLFALSPELTDEALRHLASGAPLTPNPVDGTTYATPTAGDVLRFMARRLLGRTARV